MFFVENKKRRKTHTFIVYYQNSKLNDITDITKCRTKIAQNNLLMTMKSFLFIGNNAVTNK